MEALRRAFASGARFLWDFLVGDTPEVLLTVAVMVAIAFALHTQRAASVILLPLIGLGGLSFGVWRGSEHSQEAVDEKRPPQSAADAVHD